MWSSIPETVVQYHEVQCSHKGPVGGRAEDCGSEMVDCLTLFAGDQTSDQVLACRPGWDYASNQLRSSDKTLQSMGFRRAPIECNVMFFMLLYCVLIDYSFKRV